MSQYKLFVNQRGVSLVETLISTALSLFVLTSLLLIINALIFHSYFIEKKIQLTNTLNSKLDEYMLMDYFDTSSSSSFLSFHKNDIANRTGLNGGSYKLVKLTGEDSDNNITVVKKALKKVN